MLIQLLSNIGLLKQLLRDCTDIFQRDGGSERGWGYVFFEWSPQNVFEGKGGS